MRRGTTLLEISAALLIMAIAVAALVPAGLRYRRRFAVLSAREEMIGVLARARMRAVGGRGARIELRVEPPRARVIVADTVTDMLDLADPRVRVDLGGRRRATLRYDALGIGRFANVSVTFTYGDERAGVVVSSYGRISRR